jgi:2-dehydropantoate 2-reductase
MRYAIVGAGSVGGLIGAQLTRAGHDTVLVDQWPEHVDVMQRHGICLDLSGKQITVPVHALHLYEVQSLLRNPIDMALLCVKSYDTAWATALIRDYLTEEGCVASVQNSFNESDIADVVGWDRVMGCIVNTIGVELHGPGHIVRWAPPAAAGFPVFRVGEAHGRITPRARALAEALSAVDAATVTTNLWGERWSKLTHNAMGSGLCVVLQIGLLEMYRDDWTRSVSIRLVQEAIEVGMALGFAMEPVCGIGINTWHASAREQTAMREVEEGLARWTLRIRADGQTSSLHDLRRGRRMETDYINGMVLDMAKSIGMAAPTHEEVVRLTRRVEQGEVLSRREIRDCLAP